MVSLWKQSEKNCEIIEGMANFSVKLPVIHGYCLR